MACHDMIMQNLGLMNVHGNGGLGWGATSTNGLWQAEVEAVVTGEPSGGERGWVMKQSK